jgi:hypothetical protein
LGGRDRRISEFKASQVYKVSSRIAKTIQRNPVSKNPKKKKLINKKKKERKKEKKWPDSDYFSHLTGTTSLTCILVLSDFS